MQRFCFTLDLHPDPNLIAQYIELHRHGRSEIHRSILDSGVQDMQMFLRDNRLFMIMDTSDAFTLEAKATMDRMNPAVIAWERLMARYQAIDPASNLADRWQLMTKIFQLELTEPVSGLTPGRA